VVAECAGYFF